MFIEIVSLRNGDVLMMYLSSKYKFNVPEDAVSYKIKCIDVQKNYTATEISEISEYYPSVKNIKNFNQNIQLENFNEQECLNEGYNQLKRLKKCVSDIKYKLAMLFMNYIWYVGRDGSISCFTIRNFTPTKKRKIMITFELEILYDRITTINDDVDLINKSICQIFSKNQVSHRENLQKIFDFISMKNETKYFDADIIRFEELLQRIENIRNEKKKQLINLEKEYEFKKKFFHDVEKSHIKGKLEEELRVILSLEKDTLLNVIELKENKNHQMLNIDKIMYEVLIMSNKIKLIDF